MKADALRGHLDAMILAVLEKEPLHGYAIIEALSLRSGGELDLPTGTVYPACAGWRRPVTWRAPGRRRAAGSADLEALRGRPARAGQAARGVADVSPVVDGVLGKA